MKYYPDHEFPVLLSSLINDPNMINGSNESLEIVAFNFNGPFQFLLIITEELPDSLVIWLGCINIVKNASIPI